VGVGVGVGVGDGVGVGVGVGVFHPTVSSHCSRFFHQGVLSVHDGRPGSVAAPAAAGDTTAAAASVTHTSLNRRVRAGDLR
jgi:hypothetical protein